MSQGAVRFVHSADFHLETPLFGVTEVPDHLRELFTEAPYWAAQRVFDTVMAEKADFLVLSGDVLDPLATGPRGPLFLAEQFQRLADRDIPIFWAGGRVDPPDSWLPSVPLPDNVHVFPPGGPTEFTFRPDSKQRVRLVGSSGAHGQTITSGQFAADSGDGDPTVAVVYGQAKVDQLKGPGVDYWALGGRHRRETLSQGSPWSHYPGTPQGRHPDQSGPHGCTLVQLSGKGQVQVASMPTELVRWETERVVIDEAAKRGELEAVLHERMQALRRRVPQIDLLVTWVLSGSGRLLSKLRRGSMSGEMLGMLRESYGFGPPAAWSVSLEAEVPSVLPSEWYEQQTIRGDFLREIRSLQTDPKESLGLESFLPEEKGIRSPVLVAEITDGAARERVLREASVLGVDLLSGEESQS